MQLPMGKREFRPTEDGAAHAIRALVRAYMLENIVIGAVENEFGDSDSFIQNHLCDSTGFLELIGFLEDRFGIEVEDQEMVPENLDSLNGIAAYVIKKRGS